MTKPLNSQPLVTVYIPTYNRADLLQRAVQSVLNQDYRNIELIVVDDGSTDGTHEYLTRMAEKDSRFKYFINEKNSGACVSRNKAIFAANGIFITGLDDDDYFLPHRISDFVKAWNTKNKNCIALYSNVSIKSSSGIKRSFRRARSCKSEELIVNNWIGNQVFTRTSYLKAIDGFDSQLPAWQDLDCWYRLLKHFDQYAYRISEFNYVIDISHDYDRISTKKVELLKATFNIFTIKHGLSNLEKDILKLQLNPYLKRRSPISTIVNSVFYLPKPDNILLAFKRSILNLKPRFRK